ncbi:iron uptake transporter deferrochelatase/peroxidase subunit [Nocardioides sp. KR10-350]|uniref:iron uptake transporter deferrochelatase/peroxidase subunit n=1 Tax=Nocardioides cheoyonin TaxID=3156615 RepID=UPI0032B56801
MTSEPHRAQDRTPDAPATRGGLSRRRLFAGAGAGVAVGAVAGFAGGRGTANAQPATDAGDSVDLSRSHTFYTGSHQAGIETLPQRHCVYMTFDLTTTSVTDLQVLLARWSAGIAQMMAGRPIGTVAPDRAGAVAQDTGEAYELGPSSLTVTLGLGPGVFDGRFGLAGKRPRLLADLPSLPSDSLQPALTGGDLSLQACADDPQVAYHAIRDLARMGRGTVNTRWTVMGFGRASAGKGQMTPRNLMGFKDGTRNIKEPAEFDEFVWVGDDEPAWMRGGTYQVARKIRMDIEIWDSDDVTDQQRVIGRTKEVGAPLSGKKEFDTPDFHKTVSGKAAIDPTSHIALAAHENNGGIKILRRSYNFTDGINDLGQLDAGLLFISYQNDPGHFVTLQRRLGSSDLLNEYIAHIGSGIFAVPPAPREGHYLAEGLFS